MSCHLQGRRVGKDDAARRVADGRWQCTVSQLYPGAVAHQCTEARYTSCVYGRQSQQSSVPTYSRSTPGIHLAFFSFLMSSFKYTDLFNTRKAYEAIPRFSSNQFMCICYAQSVKLPISRNRQAYCPVREMGTVSRNGQYRCRFREMGIRKPAHFTKWANVVNEIYIFVHAAAMHWRAVRQGRRLYIFKVAKVAVNSTGPVYVVGCRQRTTARLAVHDSSTRCDHCRTCRQMMMHNWQINC